MNLAEKRTTPKAPERRVQQQRPKGRKTRAVTRMESKSAQQSKHITMNLLALSPQSGMGAHPEAFNLVSILYKGVCIYKECCVLLIYISSSPGCWVNTEPCSKSGQANIPHVSGASEYTSFIVWTYTEDFIDFLSSLQGAFVSKWLSSETV